MANIINIKKGLDLPIDGAAELRTTDARTIATYAVKPTDYVGLVPRLLVAEGDTVKAGDALFCDKKNERIRFCAPVAGRVKAVVRGAKRLLLAVVVEKDENATAAPLPQAENLKEQMLQCGLWTMLRQRPFGTVANPNDNPKAIVVSCFDSAPLGPDYDYLLQGREDDFAHGVEALASLTEGKLHLCFRNGQKLMGKVAHTQAKNVELHIVNGPHPAGNVGPQIAQLCPINKGDVVWTMNPQDIATLGHLTTTGVYCPERVVAVAGPQIKSPHYFRTYLGANVETLVAGQASNSGYPRLEDASSMSGNRLISGNILSGTQIDANGFVGGYDSLLSILPEGDYYDFMGWLMPGLKKFSFSRTFLSGFFARCKNVQQMLPSCTKPVFDTNTHGEERPYVFTGNFEQVFPFDIYPLQLIKACIIGDMELQENLGIYEVEPEDFALCEFIDTSKTDIQPIIREALETLRKEAL